MKIKKLTEGFNPKSFMLVVALFTIGCYSTQCQNANHTEVASKTSTIKKDTPMKLNPLNDS